MNRHSIVKNLATGYTDGVGPLELAPWVHPNSEWRNVFDG